MKYKLKCIAKKRRLKPKGYYLVKELPNVYKCYYSTGRRKSCKVINLLKEGEPSWKGVMYYKIPDNAQYFEKNPTEYEN